MEEKETGFADHVRRQKSIASLPSIFDNIFLIYQSRQRSVMTKQELIHKIVASSPKIVDRSMWELIISISLLLLTGVCNVDFDIGWLHVQVKSRSS
jgi:hypothetical protein